VKNADGELERVRPQDIRTTALLTVEGELDDISGSGQTQAAHDLCTGIAANQREHYEAKGAGHYGIFSGRRWRDLVYPKVQKFIAAHDEAQHRALAKPSVDAEDTVKPVQTGAKPSVKPVTKAIAKPAVKPTGKPAATVRQPKAMAAGTLKSKVRAGTRAR
jgi:poly(3-hydroxybutyrate) depolymerase